jgi:hypothetical protein
MFSLLLPLDLQVKNANYCLKKSSKNTNKNILLVSLHYFCKKHITDATGWRVWDLNPSRDKIYFSCSNHPDPALRPTQHPVKWVSWFLPGGQAAGVW